MSTGIKIEGVESAVRKLEQIPRRAGKASLRKSVRAGGTVFVKEVRGNLNVRNKTLWRSIIQVVRSYGGLMMSVIGQNRSAKGA